MERYQELFHLYVLSGELSKNVSLYYHIGHLFGYSGEELMLILLYSHFSYHISLYSILMAKYLTTSSFPFIFYSITSTHGGRIMDSPVAQWVEHSKLNREVPGSFPI